MNCPTVTLTPGDANWPAQLTKRLGEDAPGALQTIGPIAFLAARRTAFFCSARTRGDAILRAYDAARHLRDGGIAVISGFHSPIERECLRILLRGKQPIIICPARVISGMRMSSECRAAFAAGRLLFLSPFVRSPKRVTRESALRRNEMVAALADDVFIAHVTPYGQTAKMAVLLGIWGVPQVAVSQVSRSKDDAIMRLRTATPRNRSHR